MKPLVLLFLSLLVACQTPNYEDSFFLTEHLPGDQPLPFNSSLVPEHSIIHRGVFSNDLEQYYMAISDTAYSNFTVLVSNRQYGEWAEPSAAFFNSEYSEHGMSFSPNGETLLFSSTRPVRQEGIPDTWHLWMSKKTNGQWTEPSFIDVPNLRNKLLSHPSLAPDGTLYFHASELDYSNMGLYYAEWKDGQYQPAQKIEFTTLKEMALCTPYLSANGDYLIFATVGTSLDLYSSKSTGLNQWSAPVKLSSAINQNGQGNPYLIPDMKQLFFASDDSKYWNVKWVSTQSFIDLQHD